MVEESEILKTDDAVVEHILQLMAARKASPPEKVHSWGKMIVHPKPGESFLSWLMRQAWTFGTTPKRLMRSEKEYWLIKENISLSLPIERLYWPVTLDVLPAFSAWENVLRERGLNKGIRDLQLDISKWFDLTKESEIAKYKLEKYYSYTLRYCPICWEDENSRYFRTLWRLPFVIVCPEHGVELKESCSSCGGLLFDDRRYRRSSTVLLQNFREKWLSNCRHCNHSLLEEGLEEKLELARLQKQIVNTLLSDSNWATPRGYLIFWHTYLTAVEKPKPDCAETRLKLMDALLKKPLLLPDPNRYSLELQAEIERRLQIVSLHLSGPSAKILTKKYDMSIRSIQKLGKDLREGRTIDEIIKRQFGNEGKFGLEIAQIEMRAFKEKYGQLPKSEDDRWRGIITAIVRGNWASFGIKKWNDLLRKTFGEINKEKGIYIGERGLEHVIAKLRAFKADNGRLPKTSDKLRGGIEDAILRGEWTSFGIKKWNDLLMKTFGEVNQEMGIYIGEQGLKRAMAELRTFKDKHGRLPINSEIRGGIKAAINHRAWASFGIVKWNDLLRKTFGKVNNETGIYFGEKGLERAIAELRTFKDIHGRLPTNDDKIGGAIQAVIIRGELDSFGIKRWNDLLRKTFGEVNAEKDIYTGEQGLERAIAELRAFRDKYGQLPTNNDKAMSGIREAIKRGEWISFDIKKWNDLL
ncbi:MAG: TniQ family protein, partial [Candidatus Subteraquimicrobiales bacterium]|nr:TniQ family protein [Candidatus Subteraquimicrobiales bacterium]